MPDPTTATRHLTFVSPSMLAGTEPAQDGGQTAKLQALSFKHRESLLLRAQRVGGKNRSGACTKQPRLHLAVTSELKTLFCQDWVISFRMN